MLGWKSRSWFYPKPTGDPGRDRNARTLQVSCFLLASGSGVVATLDAIGEGPHQTPLLVFGTAGIVAAAVMNRLGKSGWAARTVFLAVLFTTILLVFEAHDGFRSHAMLVFPGLLLISVMLLDRASYVKTAGIVLVAVAALGIAVRHGLTRATPPTHTSYDSIFYVVLNLLVIAIIGSRIARDTQSNVFDLRATIDRLSAANLELVQIREHLQDSEQRLKSAQRLTHVGSWHWNLGADQVVCSEECKRIFGQPEDYAPSLEGLLQIITPRDRERVANEIQRGIAEKSGCSMEFRIERPNGDLRTVTFTSQVLLDEKGWPRHIFGACQDVTDDRRMQEEALARQKLETVGTLANGIAHDFNNLLGAVAARAELAVTELASGESPLESIQTIMNATNRGAEIVRELMIYAGQDKPGPVESIDLSGLVEEMQEFLNVCIPKRVVLKTDLSDDLPAVLGRASQLRQIVMNLIINASEAIGDKGGIIMIAGSRTTLLPGGTLVGATNLPPGDYLKLEVSDTGVGMTEEVQAKVFDPFFSTKFAGRGLGLAVVHGLVRDLGGSIKLVTEPGKGSSFQILLPVAAAKADATHSPISETKNRADVSSQRFSVLVAEDEDALRYAVAKTLRKEGFAVLDVGDGSAALGIIRAELYRLDVLLLDLNVPGASSRQILQEARRLRPEMKVIVTSAYSEDVAAAALQGDVERFLRKPFKLGELIDLVRNR